MRKAEKKPDLLRKPGNQEKNDLSSLLLVSWLH
jgi:hypothetical protein